VGRTYRLHEGEPLGPLNGPVAWAGMFDGYQVLVFPHDQRYLSVVIVRSSTDAELRALRDPVAFDAAARAIPGVHAWIAPERAAPTSAVLLGGRPSNAYRPQHGAPGLVAVGDAVATTTPTAGRGVAMASMEVGALLGLLDDGADLVTVARPFGEWCDAEMRPWVVEHIARDTETARRLQGDDIDLSAPLTTNAIVDAAQADGRIGPHLLGYMTMRSGPSSLDPAEPIARAVYESGWRPPLTEGPTRAELLVAIAAAIPDRARTAMEPSST
jgi:hypothetical protein